MNLMNNLQNSMADWRLQDYTAILFDCDGTLVDSAHNVIACMQKSFQEAGLPIPDDLSIRRTIGLNPDVAVRDLAGRPLSFAQLDEIVTGYKTSFFHQRLQIDHHEPLFSGVRHVLEALAARHVNMAVATGKCWKRRWRWRVSGRNAPLWSAIPALT